MRAARLTILLAIALLVAAPSAAWAGEDLRTPGDVIEAGQSLDGEDVLLQGEAIGDSLRADAEHRWVNVLGGGQAIGVYMTDEMADEIAHLGKYTTSGDTVEVFGRVNTACTQHAGEFDIHARRIVIVEQGGSRDDPVSPLKLVIGLGLILVGFVEYGVYRRLSERSPA